jgi:hypothetical protein
MGIFLLGSAATKCDRQDGREAAYLSLGFDTTFEPEDRSGETLNPSGETLIIKFGAKR